MRLLIVSLALLVALPAIAEDKKSEEKKKTAANWQVPARQQNLDEVGEP